MEAVQGEVAEGAPDLSLPLKRVSANIVREWVRSTLLPGALQRLYDIGMGITQFDVVTPAGNTVKVEAPAAVQRAALRDVISIGVPQQTGLVGDVDTLPGVIALGPEELDIARDEVHMHHALPAGIEVPAAGPESPPYVAPEGHSIVEVIECARDAIAEAESDGTMQAGVQAIVSPLVTKAQAILARRRAARVRTGTPAPGVLLPPE